jgi:hypothetical protein
VTELVRAMELGAEVVKEFPGDVLGPKFIKAVHGPVPWAKIMPIGGVSEENLAEWFRAGAFAVGLGTALMKPNGVEGDTGAVREASERIVARIAEIRAKNERARQRQTLIRTRRAERTNRETGNRIEGIMPAPHALVSYPRARGARLLGSGLFGRRHPVHTGSRLYGDRDGAYRAGPDSEARRHREADRRGHAPDRESDRKAANPGRQLRKSPADHQPTS